MAKKDFLGLKSLKNEFPGLKGQKKGTLDISWRYMD